MNKNQQRRSSIFLMEIIIAIMFFSLVSAFCLRIFVRAHNLSQETAQLNNSVLTCSNIAECVSASEDELTALAELEKQYPNSASDAAGIHFYFDDNWKSCEEKNASFIVDVSYKDENYITWKISSRKSDSDTYIYNLKTEVYYGS